MSNSPDLSSLIARVEAATGPNIRLETDIAVALRIGAEGYPGRPLGSFGDGCVQADLGRDGWSVGWRIPPITASLDAAMALVERALPRSKVFLCNWPGGDKAWAARLLRDGDDSRAPTPALALILALLRALEAQPSADGSANKTNGPSDV